jgi:3-oxoacyl-[acyl-carrier-protein] synthase-3
MPEAVRRAAAAAGVGVQELARVVPHQSNLRIMEQCAADLGVPLDRVEVCVDRTGNTAAASVGIALDHALRAGRIHHGDATCLVGYGGGLSWGASVVRWEGDPPI